MIPAKILIFGESSSFWNRSFFTIDRIISPATEIDKIRPNDFIDRIFGLTIMANHKTENQPKTIIRNNLFLITATIKHVQKHTKP